MWEREREREREKKKKKTTKVESGGFFCNYQFSKFFFKVWRGGYLVAMQKTSGAIWVDKIDLAQSAQFSYYFAY